MSETQRVPRVMGPPAPDGRAGPCCSESLWWGECMHSLWAECFTRLSHTSVLTLWDALHRSPLRKPVQGVTQGRLQQVSGRAGSSDPSSLAHVLGSHAGPGMWEKVGQVLRLDWWWAQSARQGCSHVTLEAACCSLICSGAMESFYGMMVIFLFFFKNFIEMYFIYKIPSFQWFLANLQSRATVITKFQNICKT